MCRLHTRTKSLSFEACHDALMCLLARKLSDSCRQWLIVLNKPFRGSGSHKLLSELRQTCATPKKRLRSVSKILRSNRSKQFCAIAAPVQRTFALCRREPQSREIRLWLYRAVSRHNRKVPCISDKYAWSKRDIVRSQIRLDA